MRKLVDFPTTISRKWVFLFQFWLILRLFVFSLYYLFHLDKRALNRSDYHICRLDLCHAYLNIRKLFSNIHNIFNQIILHYLHLNQFWITNESNRKINETKKYGSLNSKTFSSFTMLLSFIVSLLYVYTTLRSGWKVIHIYTKVWV